MTAETMWKAYCAASGIPADTAYSAWAFGSAPDELAALVLAGVKTATASGYDLYFLPGEAEPLPSVGEYSVVLDSRDAAVCVIRTERIRILPFDEVDAEQAWKEGEGDRSLAYWRQVHDAFFTEDFAACGVTFSHDSRIVCEEFQVVFRPEAVE